MVMRNDQAACGTSTTGTGTLTLAAPPTAITSANPHAIWSGSGFGTSTGIIVDYSIVEYTNSACTTPKQSESGRGTLLLGASLTATTLARTTPLMTATSMDSPPATVSGQTSAPSPITIGTAANVVVWFGLSSFSPMGVMPYYTTGSLTNGNLLGFTPIQVPVTSGTNFTLVNQQLILQSVLLPFSGLIKSCTVWGQAGYTGGTASLKIGLYEVGSDGRPGKLLIDFGTQNSLGSATQTLTASAAQFIPAGFYFLGILAQFSGGSGTPTLRMCNSASSSMWGTAATNNLGPMMIATVGSQTALSDPCTLTSLTIRSGNNEISCAFKSD